MSKYKPYTLVGSRTVPPDIERKLFEIAAFLGKRGYTIRSGGADGSDLSGENGADSVNGPKEIYLPWLGFNGSKSTLLAPPEASDLAATIHPVWHRLKQGAQKLHARNCCQCLGHKLDSPSLFLVAYTENGEVKGGTATAITLALRNNIPVFNIGAENGLTELRNYCKKLP